MSTPAPHSVSIDWLRARLDEPGLVVIDASTHLTFQSKGPYSLESGRETYDAEHIPGAVFADLLTEFADPDVDLPWTVPSSERFAAAAGALGIGDDSHVVVYDQHQGFWATRLWWHLRLEGFDNVSVLEGGLPAWRAAGLEVTAEVAPLPAREFTARRRPELLRTAAQVLESLEDEGTRVVCVLDPETFRGENSTYARPGHIAGSVNLPLSELMDASGALKPVADLRVILGAAGLLDEGVTPVTYCGGGIAATGMAHALALVGRHDVAVYDGSLTEWTADESLPMSTGPASR